MVATWNQTFMSAILFCRQCFNATRPTLGALNGRAFSSTPLVFAPKQKSKIRIPSKKALAAKLKRKAAKKPKSIFDSEKMTLQDAINVLRAVEVSAPNSTYELLIRTELGNGVAVPKGRVTLPREPKAKKEDIILVFAEGRHADEAKKAGAHVVGGPELIEAVANNKYAATTILCTPSLIRTITPKLGRILGPRGLMPSERRGTVTEDIAGYIQRLQGSSEWRGDKTGTIRAPIAKMSFPTEDVVKNVRHFLTSVKRATGNQKDTGAKGKADANKPVTPITKVILSSTQGPGIQVADF